MAKRPNSNTSRARGSDVPSRVNAYPMSATPEQADRALSDRLRAQTAGSVPLGDAARPIPSGTVPAGGARKGGK